MFPRRYFTHKYFPERYFPPVLTLIRIIVEGTYTLLTKNINAVSLEENINATVLSDSVTKSH